METQFAVSRDGKRIAYEASGEGPALIFLHGGLIQNRKNWSEAGYIAKLGGQFRTIAVDLRGHGESDAPVEVEEYAANKLIGDVHAVADACGVGRFILWGYSFGGTLALQMGSRSERVSAAIVAGSYFGPILSDENFGQVTSSLKNLRDAKAEGRLEDFSLEQRQFAEQVDLNVSVAVFTALSQWRPAEPEDLLCPAMVFCGSRNENALIALQERQERIQRAGIGVQVFDGLDHQDEFDKTDVVVPPALSFIRSLNILG